MRQESIIPELFLPEGWSVSDKDKDKTFQAGVPTTITIVYTGEDADNYTTLTKDITIIRAACEHSDTKIRDARDATCTENGYTGDAYCKVCGDTISSGKEIPATGHTWGKWKATIPATYEAEGVESRECSVCHEKETRTIAKIAVIKGKTYTVGSMKYKITNASTNGKGTVILTGTTKSKTKLTSLSVGKTVKIGGKSFRVTAIGNNAFKGFTKLKKVTIGSNVTSIGKSAFYNCKKLSKLTIKGTKLKSVGSKAIKNIKKNAKIDVSSKKVKAYKKLFKTSTGYKKTMKIS